MAALGPSDPLRSAAAGALLPAARAAAARAGVTRLTDITRLDCLGLPVWQAVRPMSRALSVHQGKGATDADAQLGALLEAVESDSAETFGAEGPNCRFDALPGASRGESLADFALDRERPPAADASYRWAVAHDPISGGPIHLPFEIVSLDLTVDVPSAFDRGSNGLAAGASRAEAITVALMEVIERDAVTEWQTRGLLACTGDAIRLDTVPFDWLGEWRERLHRAGVSVRIYLVPSVVDLPVFACELNDMGKTGAPYRAIQGRGCHPVPEVALFKALAEAIQARATFIAGAREDLPPATYARRARGGMDIMFGVPPAPGMNGVDFGAVAPGPEGADAITDALARAGYPRIAIVPLLDGGGIAVVKAFVCGLGSVHRRRRAPVA